MKELQGGCHLKKVNVFSYEDDVMPPRLYYAPQLKEDFCKLQLFFYTKQGDRESDKFS